ncbi:unnamed protein product, partial [Rotaria magnacalcarata]
MNNGYPRNQYLCENNARRSLEQIKFIRNSKTSRATSRQRQHRQEQRQRRRSGPRQLQLNDFMPPQLRDKSQGNMPNLPVDFNLITLNTTAANTRSNVPVDALPQRSIFTTQAIRTTNDTTQPFSVYDDFNENTTTTTTASYRRRQRRTRQQQYHNTNDRNDENFNRFAALEQNDPLTDIESNYDEGDDETIDGSSRIEDNMTDYSKKEQINKKNVKNGQNKNYRNNKNDANKNDANKNDQNNKKNDKNNKLRRRIYLETNRIMRYMQDNATVIAGGRGNQAYILAAAPIYDEWIRNNYELQVWQTYLRMGIQDKHWAKEIITRTKKRDNVINSRFIKKIINRLTNSIAQASATITNLQVQLSTYWTQATAATINSTTTAIAPATNTNQIRDAVDRLEKIILKYIQHCTRHVKIKAENKIGLAQVQMEEYKALEDFKEIATPNQWNIHLILKPKIKQWSIKNKNYLAATKRVEYDLPPKFITNADFTFRIDESIIGKEEAQILYDQMRQLTKEYRMQTMSLYLQIGILPENNEVLNGEDDPGSLAFKHYNDLREKRLNLEAEQSLYFLEEQRIVGRGFLAPTIINEAKAKLTEEEYQLLKLGPRFIYNDPIAASRRRTTELALLKRKIEIRFFEKKVSPGKSVAQFIAELDRIIKNSHDKTINIDKTIRKHKEQREIITYDNLLETIDFNQYQLTKCPITTDKQKKQKNYGRLVKRLKHKLRSTNIVIQKTDKSKVFHLAYECLHQNDPLPNLIESTNKYLLKLRLDNWITQKQYEQLSVKQNEVELAHLYYLPKAPKPGTPLRPIVSGLKHPTIKISRFLDKLLRPLFDRMALSTTVTSGTEVIKQLYEWSKSNARQDTLICTMDVIDLYTMIP